MVKIKEAIVVEGRYDKNTLSQIVDAPIFVTNGFGIFKQPETVALLRAAAQKRGLIVLTDAGKRQADLMKLCAMSSYPAQKTMDAAKRLSERFCATAVKLCLEADVKLKTSFDSPDRVLELLVLELAGESRNG